MTKNLNVLIPLLCIATAAVVGFNVYAFRHLSIFDSAGTILVILDGGFLGGVLSILDNRTWK